MRCRELHGVRATRSLPNMFASLVELVDNVAGNRHQLAARIRQADRLAVATEQRDSDPFLKQANAPAEGRLRHISPGRGARKAAGFYQCQKIFEPCYAHCQIALSCRRRFVRGRTIRLKLNNCNNSYAKMIRKTLTELGESDMLSL